MEYRIDRERRLVEFADTQTPDIDEFRATMDAILADPAFRPGFGFLRDWRRIPEPPSRAYIESAFAYLAAHAGQLGSCRWAVLAEEPATYGMMRVAEALAARTSVTVLAFGDRDEALAWLLAADPS